MFRIGDFSRLSRVSAKMLRHYDELGLLKPARVDTQNDYRYYSAEQLPRLNRIVALKDLGFRLEQIAGLLADDVSPGQLEGMLLLRRAQVEQQVQDDQARLEAIEARLRQISRAGQSGADAVIRVIEAEPIASIRGVLSTLEDTDALFDELEAYVARHRARAAWPPLCIYHDTEYRDQDVDFEIAVPISVELPATARIGVCRLPRVERMACVVHVGPYAGIDAAYHALLAWIEAHGYGIAGPTREVYLRFGAEPRDYALPAAYLAHRHDAFVTELQVPVERT